MGKGRTRIQESTEYLTPLLYSIHSLVQLVSGTVPAMPVSCFLRTESARSVTEDIRIQLRRIVRDGI